jgi:hypothetical protein
MAMHGVLVKLCVLAAALPATGASQVPTPALWVDTFGVQKADLRSTGRNPYFILEPGYQLVLEGPGAERLVITVLDQTELVDGVETRVVEERETKNGKLVEVSRNFFAISSRNDVYYFGEDVDVYKNGKVANHEGAWRAGLNGARFGLMMPATPRAGARYYQEVAPHIAMDRAEVVALDVAMTTPAAKYSNVLKIEETTPLEPGAKEFKYYAAGVGLIGDGSLRLVKYSNLPAR